MIQRIGNYLLKMELRIKHIGSKKAYGVCPKHEDKRPSLVIDLIGMYAGYFRCFSCGWSGKLSPEIMSKLMTKRKKRNRLVTLDWERLNNDYVDNLNKTFGVDYTNLNFPESYASTSKNVLKDLAQNLGVSIKTLYSFSIGYDGVAFTFPFRNPSGVVIGEQRRFPNGMKCCVEGSNLGLFLAGGYYGANPTGIVGCCHKSNGQPQNCSPGQFVDCRAWQGPCHTRGMTTQTPVDYQTCLPCRASPLFITEGLSDCASVYDLGFHAIGRPSCQGQEDMIKEYLELYQIERPIIICDNDTPGIHGANELCNVLPCGINLYFPDNKDIRQDIEKLGREEVTRRLKEFI